VSDVAKTPVPPPAATRGGPGDRAFVFLGVCLVLGYLAFRGQLDDAPDRVRWVMFVAALGVAWSLPLRAAGRRQLLPRVPPDVWPWLAHAGALLFPR
jgi:hypothetical protein